MTVIAVVADSDGIWAAGDRGTSHSDASGIVRVSRSHEPKVAIVGDYLLGVTGYARLGQVIRGLDLPRPPRGRLLQLDRFMAGEFSAALRRGIEDAKADGHYVVVVGVRGRWIYEVDASGHVQRMTEGETAIGEAQYALGSLFSTRNRLGMNGRYRVVHAVEAAMHHIPTLRKPIDVVHMPVER